MGGICEDIMLRTIAFGRCNNTFLCKRLVRPENLSMESVSRNINMASIGATANAGIDVKQNFKPTSITNNSRSGSTKSSTYISPLKELFELIDANRTPLDTASMPPPPPTKKLKCGIPEDHLKFKTTSWGRLAQPPYVMAEEFRITLELKLSSLPFESEQEWDVFYKVVGPRVDKEKGILALVSNQFASRIENKRHTVSMLERIVKSVKTLCEE